MANRLKLIAAVVLVVIAIPAGRWVRHTRPWESAIQRAHRLCREGGLDDDEINRLIETKSDAGLTREQELDLLYATFEDRADAELCEPCAEAVLDVAAPRKH
jgi:hypothetical protein